MAKFQKGNIPWNKNVTGYKTQPASFSRKQKISLSHKGKKKLYPVWNKGLKIQINSGRTHFKTGQKPWNYKGGITKTTEYHSFYATKYKARKRGAFGSHTFQQWIELKNKYLNMCLCCKQFEPIVKLTEDHIIPISMGGSDNIDNIQPLCGSCNSKKHTRTINYMIGEHLIG